ncbi:MAG: hypothetical protein U0Y68_24770 [Blastocatellia bacterium]
MTPHLSSIRALTVATHLIFFTGIGLLDFNPTYMQMRFVIDQLPGGLTSADYGQQAQVEVSFGFVPRAGYPTGTIHLYMDDVLFSTIELTGVSSLFRFNLPRRPPGTYSVRANFTGTGNWGNATVEPFNITIYKGKTLASISATPNPAIYGQPITFHGQFWAPASFVDLDASQASFKLDGAVVATIPITNGMAAFTTSSLLPGNHKVEVNLLENDLFQAGPVVSTDVTVTSPGFEADVSPRPNGNNNASVSVADWVQIGRFVAGLDSTLSEAEFQRADCAPAATKGDGKLSVADWVQTGRYAAALDPVALVGGPISPVAQVAANRSIQPAPVNAASTTIVRVKSSSLRRGEISSIPLELESASGVNALSFTFNFDPRLFSFAQARAAAGWQLVLNDQQADKGQLGLLLSLPAGQVTTNDKQVFVELTFLPKGGNETVTTHLGFTDQMLHREAVDLSAAPLVALV